MASPRLNLDMPAVTQLLLCLTALLLLLLSSPPLLDSPAAALAALHKGTRPTRVHALLKPNAKAQSFGFWRGGGAGIVNHGGPVMSSPIKVYLIWAGPWTTAQKAYVKSFITSLGTPSPASNSVYSWWTINVRYTGGVGASVARSVSYVEYDYTSKLSSTVISEGGVQGVVTGAIGSAQWPYDTNGLYAVLVAGSYRVGSMCSSYCGYHDFFNVGNVPIKYLVAGALSCSGCMVTSSKPFPIDAPTTNAVSIIAHEVAEAASDPQLNAWYSDRYGGNENADMCAWSFGSLLSGSVTANMIGSDGTKFLVQQNYIQPNGPCALSG